MSEKALHHGCIERMKEIQEDRDNWKAQAEDVSCLYRAEKAENARLRKALGGVLKELDERDVWDEDQDFYDAIAAAREAMK